MAITLQHIRLPLSADESSLGLRAARALDIAQGDIKTLRVKRISLDARKKHDISFEYTLELSLDGKLEQRLIAKGAVQQAMRPEPFSPRLGVKKTALPVVVAGLGPAGLFAAYTLARFGYAPIVIERGRQAEERKADVERFWRTGSLDIHSNAMFGEGGAGAFSDGKLTTRIKDPLCGDVLDTLVRFGAPEEIAVQAKPHIGTDRLSSIVAAIRRDAERMGAKVLFETQLTGLCSTDGRITAVKVTTPQGEETIPCCACVLATGQNADDTYKMLYASGMDMTPKPFAAGVRIEHPRMLIDRAQFGDFMGNPRLGAAEYHFADNSCGRGVYTFCMCPGGTVVACSNDEGRIIVNGMSEYARDGVNSNAAIVVQVDERDFAPGPLGGLEFREKLERAAFRAGGGDYCAPATTYAAMRENKPRAGWGEVKPSYHPGVKPCELGAFLPEFMTKGIIEGVAAFGRKLRGFDMGGAVLTAIESRTSAPVRVNRSETGEALNLAGLYPCGEGAGYAGGIVSAAVDGMRTAERIMNKYAPLL